MNVTTITDNHKYFSGAKKIFDHQVKEAQNIFKEVTTSRIKTLLKEGWHELSIGDSYYLIKYSESYYDYCNRNNLNCWLTRNVEDYVECLKLENVINLALLGVDPDWV